MAARAVLWLSTETPAEQEASTAIGTSGNAALSTIALEITQISVQSPQSSMRSMQLSGVMMLDGAVDSEEEAASLARMAEQRFAGKPGQVMFVIPGSAGAGQAPPPPDRSEAAYPHRKTDVRKDLPR